MSISNARLILIYTLFSVLFLSIPIVSSPDFSMDMGFIRVGAFQRSFVVTLSALAWFFLSNFLLIPNLWKKNRKWIFVSCTVTCLVLLGLWEKYYGWRPENNLRQLMNLQKQLPGIRPPGHNSAGGYIRILIPFILATMSAFLLYIYRRNRLMEQMAMRARLQELQYQLQPHFLFNTMNNLYALSITEPAKAPQAILKLAEILRILLQNDNRDQIPVAEEIDFCRKYIALQQLKFGDAAQQNWDIRIEDKKSTQHIAPFLVIPIIENVFKYGISPGEKDEIVIHLFADDRTFRIYTKNRKVSSQKDTLMESNRNGLQKTIKRLELIYGNGFELKIDDSSNLYELELSISLI